MMKRPISLGLMLIFLAFIIASSFAQELSVVILPDEVVPKDGSATFKVEGGPVDKIKVAIYDLTGTKLSDSGWISGNEYTQDFTGYRAGAYIYVVYARIGGEEQTFRGFVYVRVQSANIKFEAGVATVTADETWQHVSFTKSFNNPVVIVKSVEGCGDPNSAKDLCDYLVPRIKNVTTEGFDIMIQVIPKNANLSQSPKRVPYIVVEAGRYKVGGFEIEAGTLETHNFVFITPKPMALHVFNPNFSKEPVVITSITSFNGPDPAATRNKTLYVEIKIGPFISIPVSIGDFRKGFTSIIDEPGWDPMLEHKNEEISYIAITPGVGVIDGYKVYVGSGDYVSDKAKKIEFPGFFSNEPVVIADMQRIKGSDWAIMRHASLTKESVKLIVAETTCGIFGCSSGGAHVKEPVGYILAGEGPTGELVAFFTAEPTYGEPPLEVVFDASESQGDIKTYSWDFGDGTTALGQQVTHIYENEGEFTVTLTVEDYEGNTSVAKKTITVAKQESQELVAVIKPDKERCYSAPCTVNFDASDSTGPIVKYDWNFGDGSDILSGADLTQVSYTFNDYGVFTVTLTVSDDGGNADSTSVIIIVGCASNDQCIGGDGCHEGICMHPELTINSSADQLLAFKGTPRETDVIWTITNVGEHAAVITDVLATGCDTITCEITMPSTVPTLEGSLDRQQNMASPPKSKVLLADADTLTVSASPNPFKQGESTTISVVTSSNRQHALIRIYNSDDQQVYSATADSTAEGTTLFSFTWNGTDTEGNILPAGTFRIYTKAWNVSTNIFGSTEVDILEGETTVEIVEHTSQLPTSTPTSVEGIIIYPYESVKVTQHISNIASGDYPLGLEVKYTDVYGAGDKTATNWQPVALKVADVDSDKFHIKLDLYDQNFCIGSDGTLGLTGNSALPKIKLSWDFVGDNAISIDECDKKLGKDFIYCDPTQFSIELAKKLRAIEELAAEGNFTEIEQHKHFKAYLIGDNYSEDFQKDFAYFYTHGFLSAPSWFTSDPSPWHLYFADPERLTFEPREVAGGLYDVTLDFKFESDEYVFFAEDAPVAKITVKFEKIHGVGVDVPISPFYFVPFNGLVGTMREDEDGIIERKDYGIGFINAGEPIILNVFNTSSIDTQASGGRETYETTIYRDFSELNIDPRGRVFEIDLAHRAMRLYASQATPVIMGIQSANNTAEAFYQLYAGDNVFGEGLSALSYWTGIAASPALGCGDFYGNALPYKVPDTSASSFDECCAISEYHLPAFGFRWANVADNESIFLSTVFYLPYDQRMSLSSACADNISIFASQGGVSTSPSEALSLETMLRIQKLQDVLNLIKSELVCVAPERNDVAPVDNTYVFFWNEQKIEEQLEQAKARIGEQWGFNWENYACSTSH